MLHRFLGVCLFAVAAANPLAALATPPTANNDSASTAYNQSVVIALLSNDTAGSHPLDPNTVTITDEPDHGFVIIDSETGDVQYDPDLTYVGQDSFSYTVKDENGAVSNTAVVSVTTTNSAPVITSFNVYEAQGGVWVFEGTVSDEDPGGLTIEFGGVLEGQWATVNYDGTFFYSAGVGVGGEVVAQTSADWFGLVSNEVAEDTGY